MLGMSANRRQPAGTEFARAERHIRLGLSSHVTERHTNCPLSGGGKNMQLLKTTHLLYLSTPAEDRAVYKAIRSNGTCRILEIGLQRAVRTKRMLELAKMAGDGTEIEYTGIDPFESRTRMDGPGWSLKRAHVELKTPGVKLRLMPGSPQVVLPRIANMIGQQDLIVIACPSNDWVEDCRGHFARLLGDNTIILLREGDASKKAFTFRQLTREWIQAGAFPVRKKAA